MAELRLLSRPGCHLCEEFEQALAAEFPRLAVQIVDIDAQPALQSRFGLRIPVLIDPHGGVICEGIFDAGRLTEFL